MQLPSRSFSQFLQDSAAIIQGSTIGLIDLSAGSVLRSVLEANASVALWIQWLILRLLQATRAATSVGNDLDSWMQDFSVVRLPATPAVGQVSFSRLSSTTPALIPIGTLVTTGDNSHTFEVVADSGSASWSEAANAFVMPTGAAAIAVPVIARTSGSSGNVQAGAISVISSPLPGADTVDNPIALFGGMDAETDDAYRDRFKNFLSTRSRATIGAIGFAITSLQQGVQYIVQENVDAAGAHRLGSFVVTVDDGSGAPAASLLDAIGSAVDQVRPIGSVFVVQGPIMVPASISLRATDQSGANISITDGSIVDAVADYVNRLPIGGSLFLTRIAQIAYAANPLVDNVRMVTINGQAADLIPPRNGAIKAALVVLN